MKRQVVGIVDYGMGNLVSVEEALSHLGMIPTRVASPFSAANVDSLVLPGVGSFPKAIAVLQESGLFEFIKEWASAKRRLVGICLGMQILHQNGEEDGNTAGLGILAGKVESLRKSTIPGLVKLPNMGWRQLEVSKVPHDPEDPLIATKGKLIALIQANPWMYFAHSYGVSCTDDPSTLAYLKVGNQSVVGLSSSEETYAFQGHPELSGKSGLKLLSVALS